MAYQKELILVKPGVLKRKIVGEIITRFEKKGLDILALKTIMPTKTQMRALYEEHKEKKFYDELVSYMICDAIVALLVGGENAIAVSRGLVGATDPLHALPGSIRGDFGLCMPNNIIHASDSTKSAQREIKLFFTTNEIIREKK